MSDIDRVMTTSTQSAAEVKPIDRRVDKFNAAAVSSKNDRAASEPEMPCAKAPPFTAKVAPLSVRRPLFRR